MRPIHCKMLASTWLFVVLCCVTAAQAKTIASEQTLHVGSQATVRSELVHLDPGYQIAVTADTADPDFAVDLYVYKRLGQSDVLMSKDDGEESSAVFAWTSTESADYYVLARNATQGSGALTVSVTHTMAPSTDRSDPPYAQIEVFYATDRNVKTNSPEGEEYGSEPDSSGGIHLGKVLVSIPRSHDMGELEGPSILKLEFSSDPAKHVVLQHVYPENRTTFFNEISRRVKHSDKREVFLFVHGFNTTFVDAARRTAQMAADLGFDGPAVFYSWPSKGKIDPVSYNQDGRNAELTTPKLKAFLNELVTQTGATTIHLIAHSMGGRVLASAITKLQADRVLSAAPMFKQVMLLAPDIDAALFRQAAQQLRPAAQRITLYVSSRDRALAAAHLFEGYDRAGQGGASITVVPGIDTIDASAVDTSMLGFSHQYYADNTQVLADLFHVMHGEPINARFGLKQQRTKAGTYWQLKPSLY